MKCSYHPYKYISCININPQIKQDRLLCVECYVDKQRDGVPNAHIHKIEKIINDPKLLFSLEHSGYEDFKYILTQKDRVLNIQEECNKMKQLVQESTELILNQLNEYSTQVEQIWTNYHSLSDYIWNYIGYNDIKEHLKSLIGTGKIEYQQYSGITREINCLFDRLNLYDNQEFIQKYTQVMEPVYQIKSLELKQLWKQNLQFQNAALEQFITIHEDIFSLEVDRGQTKEELLNEIQVLTQKKQCNICLSNDATYAAIPCGHYSYCGECKDQIHGKCSVCKQRISVMNRIYT